MTAATWILLYKKPVDAAATGEALKFFAWAYKNGGKTAQELDYVPMPAKVVKADRGLLDQGSHRRVRQAALRDDQLSERNGKGRRSPRQA